LADLYDPTSSFYKVNIDDSTTRRGQDVTAATSRANNLTDNQFDVVEKRFGTPVGQGETLAPMGADISSMFGLPVLPEFAGAPKPLSQTEWDAQQSQRLLDAGKLSDADILAGINGDIPVEQIVGPNGEPIITRRPDAVGQQAFVNKGAEAKPENAVAKFPDGRQIPARQRQDGVWLDAQTGEVLEQGFQIFKIPQAQGTASEVGLTTSTNSNIQQQLIDITVAKDTAVKLRDLIATEPASQGIVGWMRGTAQNVIQSGSELGTYFGGNVANVAKDIENGLADADLAGAFDPNIPAIDMLSNLLAFQYAKTTTGERLSNEMLRNAKTALGLDGLDANQANSIARLDQAIAQINAQQGILQDFANKGMGAVTPPAPGAAPSGDAPAGWDPEDWKYLTPEEQTQVLNGG
jgi:hypothetical protein